MKLLISCLSKKIKKFFCKKFGYIIFDIIFEVLITNKTNFMIQTLQNFGTTNLIAATIIVGLFSVAVYKIVSGIVKDIASRKLVS